MALFRCVLTTVRTSTARPGALRRRCKSLQDGTTPLYSACVQGRVDAATFCLDRGADVGQADADGASPAHIACLYGHKDAVGLCFDRAAAVDGADAKGATPLHYACSRGHADAALICLQRGADIHQANDGGDTAHELARNHETIASWLARVQEVGWTRYMSEPRYALVVLRELVVQGRARRRRELFGKKHLSRFLFPPPRARKPHLPNYPFSLVARYYWGGAP